MTERELQAGSEGDTFEPLADYLEPRFGDVYEQMGEHWTPDLRAAVTEYLLRKVSDADYGALLQELAELSLVPASSRTEQVTWIIDQNTPLDIAYACHLVAIQQAPTLDAVLAPRPNGLEPDDLALDAVLWLGTHATYQTLVSLAWEAGVPPRTIPTSRDFLGSPDPAERATAWLLNTFADAVSPTRLGAAWNTLWNPSPSDLTDDEWNLLEPFLRDRRSSLNHLSTAQRRVIDGMLYQHDHRGERRHLPPRYGTPVVVTSRRQRYKRSSRFAEILAALDGNFEAARIVAWLRSELEGPGRQAGSHA